MNVAIFALINWTNAKFWLLEIVVGLATVKKPLAYANGKGCAALWALLGELNQHLAFLLPSLRDRISLSPRLFVVAQSSTRSAVFSVR